MTDHSPCDICVPQQTGICRNNVTCECFAGFAGPACKDPASTMAGQISLVNAGAVVAGVLGGVLLTVVIGLLIFFIWKRRVKTKFLTFSPSISTTSSSSSAPVVVPALYDVALSRRDSTATSAPTITYHLYEELP